MIIPDNVTPSWTNADVANSSLYAMHRNRLWLLNYCASLWPQIFSWTVVNIYPASSSLDFRYEPGFASRAILVTVEWTEDGKGCTNSSCYGTYPDKLLCTTKDSPIIFPSGNRTDVVACQPACFAKRRDQALRKTANLQQSLTDQQNPAASCPACELDRNVLYRTRLWRFGEPEASRIHVHDEHGKFVGVEHASAGRTRAVADTNNQAQLDVDLPHIRWDPKYKNCIVVNDFIYRTVVEPPWRDTAPNCKLTNFEIGDDVFWGIRFNEGDQAHRPNYGFLVGHSTSYCRAFAKNIDKSNGSCYQPWWQKALAYTIAGDGIIHAIHAAFHPNQCSQNWGVEFGDRQQVKLSLNSETNYSIWRRNVNTRFVLPPPNVTLEDLGIDVRKTGNRLYWNNVEGVVSQFAMFSTVENLNGSHDSSEHDSEHEDDSDDSDYLYSLYHNYNEQSTESVSSVDHEAPKSVPMGERLTVEQSEKLVGEYRDLVLEKKSRFERRFAEGYVRGSIDDLRDHDLDSEIRLRWNTIQANLTSGENKWRDDLYNVPSGKSSIPYSLNANEYATQRFVFNKTVDDTRPPKHDNVTRTDAVSPATYVNSLNDERDGKTRSATDPTIESILEHINDEVNRNQLLEILTVMGISLGFDFVAMNVIKKLLRTVHSSLLQVIARYGAGKVSLALAKIGVRLGTSRMIGTVAARLSLKMMVMIGQAATVVGLVIDALSIVSLIFDIAELAGWDPGHFLNETDLSFYHDMAKFFTESLDSTRTGPLTPLELSQLLHGTVDRDPEKTADESAEETRSNVPVDNAPLANESETDKTMHIDERLDQPKWFNRKFVNCFRQSTSDTGDPAYEKNRLPILNSLTSWNIICALDYVGNLSTNSFGQRVFPDAGGKVNLEDADISALITESAYRQLYTSTSAVNFDHRAYNYRANVSQTASSLLGTVCLWSGSVSLGILSARVLRPSLQNILPFWLIACVVLLTVGLTLVYVSILFVPIAPHTSSSDDSTSEKWQISYYVDRLRNVVTR